MRLRKLIDELKLKEKNAKVGTTGSIKSIPSADLAYRYERLKESGLNPQSEEEYIKKFIEQDDNKFRTDVISNPYEQGTVKRTREERMKIIRELQDRKRKESE
jgi:hypothetical protein